MYLANTSRQNQHVWYRVPEIPAPRQQFVDAGNQIQISGDLSREAIKYVVDQLEPYGICEASAVSQQRQMTNMLWSVDKPVTRNQMLAALERNILVMDQNGLKQREAAAVAMAEQLSLSGPSGAFKGVELEVKEVRKDDGIPDVNESVVVNRRGDFVPRGGYSDKNRAEASRAPRASRRARRAAVA